MTTCVVWSQPDPDHFNGLCSNAFKRTSSTGVVGNNCSICVDPQAPGQTCESQGPRFQNCRKVVDGVFVSTWTPFFQVTITVPKPFRQGPPWYTYITPNCEDKYIGSFILGPVDWKCGRWATVSPEELYSIDLLAGPGGYCRDHSSDWRIELTWQSVRPMWTLAIKYRVPFSLDRNILCFFNGPAGFNPLLHDCRDPISFETWRNNGGDWTGSTAIQAISSTPGASVTLTPLYL